MYLKNDVYRRRKDGKRFIVVLSDDEYFVLAPLQYNPEPGIARRTVLSKASIFNCDDPAFHLYFDREALPDEPLIEETHKALASDPQEYLFDDGEKADIRQGFLNSMDIIKTSTESQRELNIVLDRPWRIEPDSVHAPFVMRKPFLIGWSNGRKFEVCVEVRMFLFKVQ